MNEAIQRVNEIYKIITEQNDIYLRIWKENMVFTWRWWLTIALLAFPWIIWFKYRKKESTGRLLLIAFFVYFATTALDSAGLPFGLWHYNITPLPYIHAYYMPWDLCLFPVAITLMIQYKPNISPYLKALIFALACALIFEPIFEWIDIYETPKWNPYYGIPIYFIIYLLANKIGKIKGFEDI